MILVEQRDALLAAGLRIGLEGAPGGGDRLVDVGLGAERNLIHRLFGRRIDDGRGLLDDGIDPGAIDVELHAVDHRKPLDFRANGGGTERSAGILARKPGKLNPPYAGRRVAADAAYKVSGVKEARRVIPRRPGERAGAHNHATAIVKQAVGHLSRQQPPRRMGPGVRRDDGRVPIITPPFCGAAPARRR